MSYFKYLNLLIVLVFSFSCSNKKDVENYGQETEEVSSKIFIENKNSIYAKKELENAKTNNKFSPDEVISDSKTAVKIAESILFPIYGKENIIKQRPYEVNFIDEYYVISGTLPKSEIGGVFIIIINSKNGEVIKLTHGE